MNIPLIDAGLKLGNGIVDVIDQLVEDKDLAAKLKVELVKSQQEFMRSIYGSEHTPTIVKILYAFRDLVIPTLRPIGSALMPVVMIYAQSKGIEIPNELVAGAAALFPGWMYSRHKGKAQEQLVTADIERQKTKRAQIALDRARIEVGKPGGQPGTYPGVIDSDIG